MKQRREHDLKDLESKIFKDEKIINKKTKISERQNAEALREFKKLLDEGIITEEEFEAKKKQLLGL